MLQCPRRPIIFVYSASARSRGWLHCYRSDAFEDPKFELALHTRVVRTCAIPRRALVPASRRPRSPPTFVTVVSRAYPPSPAPFRRDRTPSVTGHHFLRTRRAQVSRCSASASVSDAEQWLRTSEWTFSTNPRDLIPRAAPPYRKLFGRRVGSRVAVTVLRTSLVIYMYIIL